MTKPIPDNLAIQTGQTVLFIGDSITDCNRRDLDPPLGTGYVRIIADALTAKHPKRNIQFINRGVSGNIILDLQDRWQKDALDHKPDWLSVLIGINDLHRCLWPELGPGEQPQEYHRVYENLLQQTTENAPVKLILMDPFYICREEEDEIAAQTVLAELPKYTHIVKQLAQQFNAIHIPLHEIFHQHLKYRPAQHFCPEPVHPNFTGHMVIAQAWLHALTTPKNNSD